MRKIWTYLNTVASIGGSNEGQTVIKSKRDHPTSPVPVVPALGCLTHTQA